MAEGKRSDPKRRGPVSRPEASGRGRSRPAKGGAREASRANLRGQNESPGMALTQPIRRIVAEAVAHQSEQRLGFTARRAAILAAVICVLTLTIAGPVRTYFAQRTEMKQLAQTEASLRAQIAELEGQKAKLADPAFIAAQARERLGFVMPGEIPYQVQLPPGAVPAPVAGPSDQPVRSSDPWYTSLWHTIADDPHTAPAANPGDEPAGADGSVAPPLPSDEPGPVPPAPPPGG
ncbi:MAG: septum formation initiator family protein [Mycobacterium sp.]|nr:septum formation initiator family protein [Mycobacterium sp.]